MKETLIVLAWTIATLIAIGTMMTAVFTGIENSTNCIMMVISMIMMVIIIYATVYFEEKEKKGKRKIENIIKEVDPIPILIEGEKRARFRQMQRQVQRDNVERELRIREEKVEALPVIPEIVEDRIENRLDILDII